MELFIGAIVSLVVQGIKKVAGTSEYKTLALTLLVSLIGAVLYDIVLNTGYYDALYKILTTAGAFYAFVIRRFDK